MARLPPATIRMRSTSTPPTSTFFVANYRDRHRSSGYQITSNGVPPAALLPGVARPRPVPMFVYVEPSSGRYLYTANFLDNTVSGFGLNPNTGCVVRRAEFAVPCCWPTDGDDRRGPTAAHSIEVLPIY